MERQGYSYIPIDAWGGGLIIQLSLQIAYLQPIMRR